MKDGDGVEALEHHQMLPGAGRQNNYLGHGDGNGGASKGGRDYFCGMLYRGYREDGRPGMGQLDCGGGGNGRPRRSCGALPPETTGVVKGLEDPDRLYTGIRPPDLPKLGRSGTEAQF